MPKDRFKEILKNLHFCDNYIADEENRLYKIQKIIDLLSEKFRSVYVPSEFISVEVPVEIKRTTEIPSVHSGQRARFGIKVYKLCQSKGTCHGYTYAGSTLAKIGTKHELR